MKKQILISRVLEFGGSNSYLKTLVKYLGTENVLIVVRNKEEYLFANKIDFGGDVECKIIPALHEIPVFRRDSIWYNFKQLYKILKSLLIVFTLSARFGFAGISISVIEPEKYLYLFWIPFIRIKYILHSKPYDTVHRITSFTCNTTLGTKKNIITVSNSNRNSIVTNWRISKKREKYVYVVYNCLVENTSTIESVSLNSGSKMVLTMGHVEEYKNPFLWMEVARRVTSLRSNTFFYWLGKGSLFQTLQDGVKNFDNIKLVGIVENPRSYLENATIYYQPSLIETQGIAVIEAMAHRLPCVVSNNGGLPESVEHNKNGYVVSDDNVEQNVNHIIELLDNPALCETFGNHGHEKYLQAFTYEKFARQMDKLYHLN